MTELSPEDRAAIVQEALRFKFGRLLEWARPTILHPFGPNNLLVVDEYETRLEYTKKVVVDALSEWADEKLLKLSGSLKERRRLADEEWNALGNPAIQELFSLQPGPLAYGFGHPSLKADFEYWGKMPKLTIYETVALSVGADPAAFPAERFYVRKGSSVARTPCSRNA